MLRPTAYLRFDFDPAHDQPKYDSMANRVYAYIAPVSVGRADEQSIVMRVKLPNHPYWNKGEAEDETWDTVLMPWLQNKTNKLLMTLQGCNDPSTRSYEETVRFRWLKLELNDRTVSLYLGDDEVGDLVPTLTAIRDIINDDETASEATEIFVPSRETVEQFEASAEAEEDESAPLEEAEMPDEIVEAEDESDSDEGVETDERISIDRGEIEFVLPNGSQCLRTW